MKLKVLHSLLLMGLLFTTQVDARFPEFGFCPLGGLPGWLNRMNGQSHRHYPPPYPVRSTYMPYRGYAYPAPRYRLQYLQQNPVRANNR